MTRLMFAVIVTGATVLPLAGRNAQTNETTPRPVFHEEPGFTTDISGDGRLALVNTHPFGSSTRDNPSRLEIRHLLTKTTTTLATGRSPMGRPAAVFSGDSTRVAFTWTEPVPDAWSPGMLRTVLMVAATGLGGKARVLVPADGRGTVPHGWSPDGNHILALVHGPGASIADPTALVWVSASNGSTRTIKTLEPWRGGAAARPRLSADGKWIAYSAIARQGSSDRNVYVIDADGQNERVVGNVAGTNTAPVWTPDSAHVAFVNSQPRRKALFIAAVPDTEDPRQPVQLPGDSPDEPIRISTFGELFYIRAENLGWVQVIADRSTGRVEQAFPGFGGSWFGDTKFAFLRAGADGTDLIVRSAVADEERTYTHSGLSVAAPRWSTEGSSVVVHIRAAGDAGRSGGGFYRVDLRTGRFTRLLSKDTPDRVLSTAFVLLPDNRTLCLAARANERAAWTHIAGMDLETGSEQVIAVIPGLGATDAPGLALHPDGAIMAIQAADGRIVTVGIDGRGYRELYVPVRGSPAGVSPATGSPEAIKWTSDGRSILFAAPGKSDAASWRLMRIPASGGAPEFHGFEASEVGSKGPLPGFVIRDVLSLDVSADGSRVAFSARAVPNFNVWALPRAAPFLPNERR